MVTGSILDAPETPGKTTLEEGLVQPRRCNRKHQPAAPASRHGHEHQAADLRSAQEILLPLDNDRHKRVIQILPIHPEDLLADPGFVPMPS